MRINQPGATNQPRFGLPILNPMTELRVVTETCFSKQFIASLTRMLGQLVQEGAALGWTEPPPSAEISELLTELTTGPADETCVVVEKGRDEVIGFGYWQRYERPTHRPHADLEKLAVDPSYAGAGLGRRLLRTLIEQARLAGVEQLTLDFRGDNQAAEHLYLSEGFREYGRLPDFVAPTKDRRLDKVFHVLDLRNSAP